MDEVGGGGAIKKGVNRKDKSHMQDRTIVH